MKSRATREFWRLFQQLPPAIQKAARKQYVLWLANPRHSSVRFKQVQSNLWSARIAKGYRLLQRKMAIRGSGSGSELTISTSIF